MATTQRTSTRTALTGIAVLLAGWLALAGAAQAEVETTPVAMASTAATKCREARIRRIIVLWTVRQARHGRRLSATGAGPSICDSPGRARGSF